MFYVVCVSQNTSWIGRFPPYVALLTNRGSFSSLFSFFNETCPSYTKAFNMLITSIAILHSFAIASLANKKNKKQRERDNDE